MALSQAYLNEVLNQLPSTVVVDERTWPELVKALKFTDRDLNALVIGRMKLRMAQGGYDGLLKNLDALLKENEELRIQAARTHQLETLQRERDDLAERVIVAEAERDHLREETKAKQRQREPVHA